MSENTDFGARKGKITNILNTMFDYLGLNASFKIEEQENRIMVKISSDDAGRIIGRKGQTLDSLQLLVNRIIFKEDENCPRISLDIDGYSRDSRRRGNDGESGRRGGYGERRDREDTRASQEMLERQALDAAKEVVKWGEPVTLPEMNAHDRRIIHITLKDNPQVVTSSEGDGAIKKVIVSLKKD